MVDDEELIELVEMEVREFFLSMISQVMIFQLFKDLLLGGLNGDAKWVENY